MKIQTHTAIEKTTTVLLSEKDLIRLLRKSGLKVPRKAKVTFYVPGGGDWSNMTVDVDKDNPITVAWSTT